ncbi:MAG: hypothetical protein ACWA44_15615 [Thiotrichales bacterium]
MPIKSHINRQQRIKNVVFTGKISKMDFEKYSASLSIANLDAYDVAFVDLSEMDSCEFGFDEISPHADQTQLLGGINRGMTEVILAPTDLSYGIARMYAALATENIDVQVFKDAEKAQVALAAALDREKNTISN